MAADRPVVYLHIGAMKTGTTYLQKLMEVNAPALADAGYLFPVEGGWGRQVLAAREALRMHGDGRTRKRARGKWDMVAKQMMTYDGNASVFSMEFLSFAKRPGAKRVTSSLSDAEVHVILTVRDATGAIPAQWQTSTRNGHVEAWREFAEQVMAEPPDEKSTGYRVFHRAQNIQSIMDTWLEFVPPERFHIVTVPPSTAPKTLLWERFASVIGVDPSVATLPPPTSNESIGAASADLMRRLNLELGPLKLSDYRPTVKTALAAKALPERAKLESRARTNQQLRDFAARTNAMARDAITSAGVQLVGDLDDLPIVAAQAPDDGPDDLTVPADEEILESVAFAIPKMRELIRRRTKQLDEAGIDTEELRAPLADLPRNPKPKRWRGADDPVHAAVLELAGIIRVAIELQRMVYTLVDKSG